MKRIPRLIFVAGLGPQEEFKREAIRLVNEQGLTIAEASRKLDVASKSLRTWMKQEQSGELKASLGADGACSTIGAPERNRRRLA